MSDAKSEYERRPLEVRMDPKDPLSALVMWKGQPIGALRDVQLSVDETTAKVRIVRAAGIDRNEVVWQEMRDAGIEVEDVETH